MFYAKNVPQRQRALRVILGAVLIGTGVYLYHFTWQTIAYAVAGVLMMLTGFIGYCPFCSIANRISPQK
jgi:threonine/homoserine/homoserine lactone efflux protein